MIRIKARARVVAFALPGMWGAVAATYELTCPLAQEDGLGTRIATSAVFLVVGAGLIAGVRRALLRELAQVREVAVAAQRVLLRPLPPRLDGLAVAAGQLSAHRGADVGGDLYEAVATEHGVRVVMGDVRGHGLAPLGTVAAVLGSFREAAHDEGELAGVLRRLERALGRCLGVAEGGDGSPEGADGEEFVTVLLLEIRPDGSVFALNCGHPWPYRLGRRGCTGAGVERMPGGEPLPPLGPFPLPEALSVRYCGRILPGEVLLLHTDGVEDARDAAGRFFPLRSALTEAAAARTPEPDELVGALRGALLRHTRHTDGRSGDDMALLALRNDRHRVPRQGGGAVSAKSQASTAS